MMGLLALVGISIIRPTLPAPAPMPDGELRTMALGVPPPCARRQDQAALASHREQPGGQVAGQDLEQGVQGAPMPDSDRRVLQMDGRPGR
jgi:hypothetical protein